MEFDKSKILTVVTADQAKVGQKGWFSSNIENLAYLVREERPKELLGFNSNNAVHAFRTSFQNHALFYPVPEPTYAERQAQWIKENNVKEGMRVRVTRTFASREDGCGIPTNDSKVLIVGDGTCTIKKITPTYISVYSTKIDDWWSFPYFVLEVIKEPTYAERQAQWVKANGVKEGTKVRITRGFSATEDGSYCACHSWAKGREGVVSAIHYEFIYVEMEPFDIWSCPFTALEVIKESTYRPFANAEEFAPHRDEWFRVKVGGGFERITFYDDDGVRGAKEPLISYAKLFEAGERENGEPCGVKES